MSSMIELYPSPWIFVEKNNVILRKYIVTSLEAEGYWANPCSVNNLLKEMKRSYSSRLSLRQQPI